MTHRRPGRRGARARAAIPLLLVIALVAACAPSATGPSPAVSSPAALPTARTFAVGPTFDPATNAPTPGATPDPVGVEDDDAEGDPDAAQASPLATPVAAPTPTPKPTPAPPKKPLEVSLFHPGDWVGQYTLTWCVGASIQMMVNVALPGQDRSQATQADYMLMAQGGTELNMERGARSSGWARALGELGVGQYVVAYQFTYQDALRAAARAMRLTRRPVGLLVWGGKHAWVMTGFTSIGDPKLHDDFEVTGIRVLDPLYPRDNSDLGPSPVPNALLTPSQLDDYFVGWRWRTRSSWTEGSSFGSWRMVLPVSA